jgi:hypothetical protein
MNQNEISVNILLRTAAVRLVDAMGEQISMNHAPSLVDQRIAYSIGEVRKLLDNALNLINHPNYRVGQIR